MRSIQLPSFPTKRRSGARRNRRRRTLREERITRTINENVQNIFPSIMLPKQLKYLSSGPANN